MIENWKNTLDKGGFVAAIFIDLSKVFDTLNHNLLIVNLGACRLQKDTLTIMKNYLSNSLQRVQVNSSFSSWGKIFSGVLQLANIFLNDLFLFTTNLSLNSYADDKFLYACGQKLDEINHILHCDFEKVTKWFYENYMVLNQGKCHFMCFGRNSDNETFIFENKTMKNSEEQQILGIIIDN